MYSPNLPSPATNFSSLFTKRDAFCGQDVNHMREDYWCCDFIAGKHPTLVEYYIPMGHTVPKVSDMQYAVTWAFVSVELDAVGKGVPNRQLGATNLSPLGSGRRHIVWERDFFRLLHFAPTIQKSGLAARFVVEIIICEAISFR